MVLAAALDALEARPHPVPARQWPGTLRGLDQHGLYAWWVDDAGAGELSLCLGTTLPAGRIYVGQAGAASSSAGIPSAATLRSRIAGDHLSGKVRGSTLRRTLAAILLAPLSLAVVGPKRLDSASEAKLSAWMASHLSVAVHPVDSGEQLAELEKLVVTTLQPPLNIAHGADGALRRRLVAMRAVVIHGIDDLWVAPDPELADWRRILGDYGQAFDGHRYARAVHRRECSVVAEEVWRRRAEEGVFASSFGDLRCALFWLQLCVHNAEQTPGWRPDEELAQQIGLLYGEIQEAWRREWGVASCESGASES